MKEKSEAALAGEAIRTAIRDQIETGTPAEAKSTFERLLTSGMAPEQAIEFMAAVLAAEMFGMLKNQTPYDEAHYEAALRDLPVLPWEKE